jgi:hypothetical protein
MCDLLGCPDDQLAIYLKTKNLSAEKFLRAFLQAAQPFSLMFSEIWEYLADHLAPKASETITIKFGFPDDLGIEEINLEQFRQYDQQAKRLVYMEIKEVWDSSTLSRLFPISHLLVPTSTEWDNRYSYSRGMIKTLPKIIIGSHPIDMFIADVRNLFQQVIDDNHQLSYEVRPETSNLILDNNASLLMDLMPKWAYIFYNIGNLAVDDKDKAYALYQKDLLPHLETREIVRDQLINEALEILDLPFWKHRWHTYEIWCTVRALKSMDELGPMPCVVDGRITLDGYSKEVIAVLENCRDYPAACVVIQEQTPIAYKKRKAMKPDLRICFSSNESGTTNTAAVIEFKQRATIDNAHIEEVANSYILGSPNSGGTIILNYDSTSVSPSLPAKSYYMEVLGLTIRKKSALSAKN